MARFFSSSRSVRYCIPDFIIDIFEPFIIFLIVTLHPRVPSLDIAVFTIAKCRFISHLFGLSGIVFIIVVIFDMSEHICMCAEAGLNVKTATRRPIGNAEYFILNSFIGAVRPPTGGGLYFTIQAFS